jgi:hypothetical protein
VIIRRRCAQSVASAPIAGVASRNGENQGSTELGRSKELSHGASVWQVKGRIKYKPRARVMQVRTARAGGRSRERNVMGQHSWQIAPPAASASWRSYPPPGPGDGEEASIPAGGILQCQHSGAVPQRSLVPSIHILLQLQLPLKQTHESAQPSEAQLSVCRHMYLSEVSQRSPSLG